MSRHALETESGERFGFGEDWSRLLELLDEGRIERAEESLKETLEVEDLAGRSFLDIGSCGGLFTRPPRPKRFSTSAAREASASRA